MENILYAHSPSIASLTLGESTIQKESVHWKKGLNAKGQCVLKRIVTKVPLLQTRHYIRQGETCSICWEGIWSIRQAFLNPCGHGFHYACMAKYSLYSTSCPLCRKSVELATAQKGIYENAGISRADQIEMTPELNFPRICPRRKKPCHSLGTQKDCRICLAFLKE